MAEPTVDWIKQNYQGYTGWNDPASIVADYKVTGGQGKGGPTQQANYGQNSYSMPSYQTPQVDFSKILEQAQGIYNQSIQPQVQQLQAQTPQAETRYQQLLKDITGQTQKGVTEEMTRRGIPISSGMTQDIVGQRVAAPIAQAGQIREDYLTDLARQIAQLQGGAMTGATGLATNLYGTQMQAGESAASRALQSYQQQIQQQQFQQELAAKEAARQAEADWNQRVYETINLPESQTNIANTRSIMGQRVATTLDPITEATELQNILGGGILGLNETIANATGFNRPAAKPGLTNFWGQ